jgi:hypothetical protein
MHYPSQGFIQWGGGDGGIYPRHEFDMKGAINLIFWGICLSGFENLITLSVILRHLQAELSILSCLKLIRGLFPKLLPALFLKKPF